MEVQETGPSSCVGSASQFQGVFFKGIDVLIWPLAINVDSPNCKGLVTINDSMCGIVEIH